MSSITSGNDKQYADSKKLAARARLNSEYTIAEIGWFPWVAQQLPLKSGDHILDIGCGPGWFWVAAAASLPDKLSLMLCDLSPGMVQEAIERCSPLLFGSIAGRQADAAALPYADGSLDAVVAMHMFYHLPEPAKCAAEMYRVLKPGGFLAVTTNGADNMRKMYELTAVFGSPPHDPAGAAFGYDAAKRLMQAQFGNVAMTEYPARVRVTEPEDIFLALTSYPPGEGASEAQLSEFHTAIADAFRAGNGVLEIEKQTALFVSRKVA
ncbi:class I SAM-dependent methyltransferase [Rhizobium lusitanum]|uniref:SAM-dependent methyltransferase n=1 Tax=Rhizobium lusitanum TaxID=293958 RepID=A0A7X0IPA9_9HYPH|nr:class I SAM-dependent methyltransferase [Rhizobium lusitanum]MBB6484665.1 SAM-dependent methyltransferase [Rhizobium lusitanum]